MCSRRHKLAYLAIVAALALSSAAQTSPTLKPAGKVRTGVNRKTSAAKPAAQQRPESVVQQAPPAPPPPSRPYEMSPVPPQVMYRGGQLTISAPNSTLADILNAVRVRTGAKVDFPSNASQERVAVQLGPGSPRDVLSELLHGSPFDYILLGSDQDPNAVTQIMLMRRESGGTAVASGNAPNQAPAQPEPSDDDADNETAAPAQPLARPTPGQVVPGQPANIAQPMAGSPAMQQAPEQNAPAVQTPLPGATQPSQDGAKTPEQLLQQLQQQMQREDQQRRQRPPR